ATGEVVQVGGSFGFGSIVFNDNGAGRGTYHAKDTLIEPFQIRDDTAAGFSGMYFDNVRLKAGAVANANFFQGLDVAEIQAGGLIVETIVDVNIAQRLSGSGSLTKESFGTLTMTGANSYAGNTHILDGKLVLPTVQTNAGGIFVADGTELSVLARSNGASLTVGGLQFQGGSFHTLTFDLGALSTPTAPLLKTTSVSVNGPVVINVANGVELTTGPIVLVDYDGAISGGFQFTLGTLPPGVSATLVHNIANSSIDLDITAVPGYRWTGASNGDWDTWTQNWVSLENGSPSTFADGFTTEFLDGAATGNINLLLSPASPASLIVSNDTLPYVWSGGAITSSKLRKFGTNSLTRVEGVSDNIGQIELNAGSYVVNNSSDATFATVLTDIGVGSGTFVKQGNGTLTVSNNNSTYDGAIVVQQGIYKMGVAGALGSTLGGTVIANGATLDVNDFVAPHEPVIVSGSGVGGQGAIIDSTPGGGVAHNLTDVTMVGDTTFGNPNGGRWDIRVRTATGIGPGLKGNGFNLTKVGSGHMSIASMRQFSPETQPYWQMNLGDVFIHQGTLTFAESVTPGNPSKIIAVAPGATFATFGLHATNPIVRNIYLTNATLMSGGSVDATNLFAGTVHLVNGGHFRANDAKLVVTAAVAGVGPLGISASGEGATFLHGVSTFTGDTYVTNGVFGGSGTLPGNLVMLGGTFSPGSGVGAFTVNGDVTLAGTTQMELNRALTPNSDRVVVGGALNLGGVLNVVLAAGAPAPQAGDVYQLFNKGGSGSFSAINLPDLSALPGSLSWDISNLAVNGTITVVGSGAPPTIVAVQIQGGNLVFSGTGGVEGSTYVVIATTDLAIPMANWIPVATNTFGAGGSFSVTHEIDAEMPEVFFSLQVE
ncbi:MAG: autotransporter-associated beta strand repeat-containing protein, partial [Limisphaerales bacterium]